jgi:hypothetical protein
MKKTYVTPEMSVYAVSPVTLLSASNFDVEIPESSDDGFVNTGDGGIPPGEAL